MSWDEKPLPKEIIQDRIRALEHAKQGDDGEWRTLTKPETEAHRAACITHSAAMEARAFAAEGKLREYRSAITALDCWMEKHDPKASSDYWRWRHRYHAIVNDARGDHE